MRTCALLFLALLPGCSKGRQSADRVNTAQAVEQLKKIGLAIHNHDDTYGTLPSGIYTTDNRVGLSWRVQLLPHLQHDALYKQFKLDEPWDSPHNRPLLDQMPAVFATSGVSAPAGYTHLRAFVAVAGPHKAMLPGPAEMNPKQVRPAGSPVTVRRLHQFRDGTSNGFMVVEAAEAVPWTKPEGLEFDPDKPLPKLGVLPGGFLALLGDGSVALIPDTLPQSSLRFGITIDDGHLNPPDLSDAILGKAAK